MAKAPTKSPAQDRDDRSREETVEANRAAFEEMDQAEPLTGVDNMYPEPPSDPDAPIAHPAGDFYDNPENPRGIPDYLASGAPDSQATDAQKAQNPTPQRPPYAADLDPPMSIPERVSAGQNRKPPQEVIPALFLTFLVSSLIETLL
jgi:hypothetical protein